MVDQPSFQDDDLAQAESLLNLDEETLFRRLGELEQEHGIIPDLLQAGREQFNIVLARSKNSICSSPTVRSLWNTDKGDRRIELICAIADVLGQTNGALTIAALIVKEGLSSICATIWTSEGE